MSYEKNTWSNGDIITAEKLNHIEDGISDTKIFLAERTLDESEQLYSLNITHKQAIEIFNNGGMIFLISNENNDPNKKVLDMMSFITLDKSGSYNRYEIRFGSA